MALTNWHNDVAQKYANMNHGKVNELRKNKANISTPSGVENVEYWKMDIWLIEHGVCIEDERSKPVKPTPEMVKLRHSELCKRAVFVADGLL